MTENTINMDASPGFAAWMAAQGISIGFTSYEAGKLILLGSDPTGQLTATDVSLERCMGLGLGKRRLWAASTHQLWRFDNVLEPGQRYENHDAVFLPVQAHMTGAVDVHDIAEDETGRPIFAVPRFNCIATLADGYSFEPLWKPSFIDAIAAEDRCHLNGLAMTEGHAAFATCVAATNESGAWREHKRDGGIVVDIATGKTVAANLSMPHSPRFDGERLWLHESGTGSFGRIDLVSGAFTRIAELPGFPRGLALHGDWAVIGLSKPRHDGEFGGLEVGERLAHTGQEPICALVCFNLQTGQIDFQVQIGPDVKEIYDVTVLTNCRNPLLVDPASENARFFIRPKV